MTEEEEFEFRLRLEQEQEVAPQTLDPREYNPLSFKNIVGAAVEPGLAMGTSGIAAAKGGWDAIDAYARNELIGRGMEGQITDPVGKVEQALSDYTYQPRTRGGQVATEAITAPFAKYAGVAKEMGDRSQRYTGSPAYGAGTEAMMHALPMALVPKAISGRPVSPKLNAAVSYAPRKVAQGGRAVKEAILNRLPGGTDRAVVDIIRDTAGPRIGQVGAAIENAPKGYTGGQAAVPAKSYEYSALSKMAEEKLPSDYGAIKDAQQAGRIDDLRMVGGSPESLAAMKNVRKNVADALYAKGREGSIPEAKVSKVVAKIDKLIEDNPGFPELITQLKSSRKGLVDESGAMRTNAQQVMSTVEGLKKVILNKDAGNMKGPLIGLKKDVVGLSDDYVKADQFYAQTSRPITQMEIGQTLEKTIAPRMGSTERATAYKTAMDNQKALLRKANEGKKTVANELSTVMEKEQIKVFDKVGKEIDNNVDFKAQATAGRKKMNEVVGTMWDSPKAKILERAMVIFNMILKRIEGRNASATLERFAELNKPENRPELLKFIEKATPEEKAVLLAASKIRDKAIAAEMTGGALQLDQENN